MPHHAGYSSTMILLKPATKSFIETYSQWLEIFVKRGDISISHDSLSPSLHFSNAWTELKCGDQI